MWGTPEIKNEKLVVEQKKPVPAIEKQKMNLTSLSPVQAEQALWKVVDKINQNPSIENPIVKEMFAKIDKDTALKDETWGKIQDLLKEWKIREAIKAWFDLIFNSIFGSKDKNKTTELFFPQFKHLEADIAKLDLWAKTPSELIELKNSFENKISSADSVKRKISYTYILSRIIEQYERKEHPAITWLQIVEKQLTVWSVILLNKQKPWVWGQLLQWVWGAADVDITHVVVITQMWPPIAFSHATEHKFSNSSQSGVETNVPLWDYLKWNSADIVITNPPQEHKKKLEQRLQNLKADEAYTYDRGAAVKSLMWVDGATWKTSWKFNCGTYVQEVLWMDSKDLGFPGAWLKNERLKPSYMFTFDPKNQGS